MIPPVIHYCWFGSKPLPQSALKCIASWRKFLPDYEIREWNESNFDVRMIPYTAEAYAAKKYAFVSDVARYWILHEHGGIYFDTDVEVIRPLDDILAKGAFMGIEAKAKPDQEQFYVNPGVGFACEAANPVWARVIEAYRGFSHFLPDEQGTICTITTSVLSEMGIKVGGQLVSHDALTIYPPDFFCPQAMMGAPIVLTENTRSIHHFDCTWLPRSVRLRLKLMNYLPYSVAGMLRSLFRRTPR